MRALWVWCLVCSWLWVGCGYQVAELERRRENVGEVCKPGTSTAPEAGAFWETEQGLLRDHMCVLWRSVALVSPEKWALVSAAEDPFGDRPKDAVCPSFAYTPHPVNDTKGLEISTGACRYFTASQGLQVEIGEGEQVRVVLWHDILRAEEAAQAHVALRLGSSLVWEQRVPIPAEKGLVVGSWRANERFAAGTPVFFHLHNHGANVWLLVSIEKLKRVE